MSKPSHPFSLFRNEQMCYNRSEKGGGAMDRIILHWHHTAKEAAV